MDKKDLSDELIFANRELVIQNQEKAKLAAELILANIELDLQNEEKITRANELAIANKELDFQNSEKLKRAKELISANKKLDLLYEEKEKRAAELIVANAELVFQNQEKEKRAAELIIANAELIFQNQEKENRAAELAIANTELIFQNEEKEKRAQELIIADTELLIQAQEKVRRAEAEAKKDEFFNIVSHEFKTPLTSIKAINQLLEKTVNKTDKSYPFILNASHSIKRLERLIEDLLDVTKINAGQIDLNITEFNFADALVNSIFNVQQTSNQHQILLENDIDIRYMGDQFRIEQVMVNLLNNAIKYSPNASLIIVKAEVEAGRIIVVVQDFGIGIAKEDIDQLFKRFYRVSKTAMHYQGVGLGLYIASEIIKKHNGSFTIESEPGKGSSFYFYLPLEQNSTAP
jgi:signal transduction histidine kinase